MNSSAHKTLNTMESAESYCVRILMMDKRQFSPLLASAILQELCSARLQDHWGKTFVSASIEFAL